jgi:hypothetical protein
MFSDDDVSDAVGEFHRDLLRELIKTGAIEPIGGGGHGVTRRWDTAAVERVAVVAALFHAGFALPMAHVLAATVGFSLDVPRHPGDVVLEVVDGRFVFVLRGERSPKLVGMLEQRRRRLATPLATVRHALEPPGSICEGVWWRCQNSALMVRVVSALPNAEAAAARLEPVSLLRVDLSLAVRRALSRLAAPELTDE